ncbi:hypothetical protein [Malikia granosa]|nr:hypothetical protein [Malikia granosa]
MLTMIPALTMPLARAIADPVRSAMTLPFEAARQQYSLAVKVGLQPNSMLAYRQHFNSLDQLEKATLGAFARQV